ncbi:helix-turn-helix transcriptional regulator [Aquiflexum gelatinilyticum]|uniref:helix-turn-helix transcriptional regulator n=1 Tax=Aquiflexum gelatinilyticum TaxID=2961943 RepID=UPI002167068A|nr:WYL domain-containing protein [Aquiflexum gelatinilyticum]MCS4432852.1 WYL domain-containing protein [Aquiflexum gelatinilyticum]
MSINKNAYLRYHMLDKCFSNKYRLYFIEDLLEEVNRALEDFNGEGSKIEKRQLFDDIKFMESEAGWSIPLERIKQGKKVYYRYFEKDFSIKNQKISDEELDAINAALMVLLRFRGLPQFEWVNELIPKLQSLFRQDVIKEVIRFDENEFLVGLDYLPILYKSIIKEISLKIEYQSFKETQPISMTIHPYYLKQFNKRWFLFGLNDSNELIYNLPLDRIKSIAPDIIKFKKNTAVDFTEYFEDIIGVSFRSNQEPIKINLLIDIEISPYILTKPLHGSQKKIDSTDRGIIIQIEVIPNHELRQLLLSYGDGLQVISPESYKNELKEVIERMYKKYKTQI